MVGQAAGGQVGLIGLAGVPFGLARHHQDRHHERSGHDDQAGHWQAVHQARQIACLVL